MKGCAGFWVGMSAGLLAGAAMGMQLQMLVKEREAYIAKVDNPRSFPWRMSIVTTSDKDLAASNLSYLLAAPSRLTDISWIKQIGRASCRERV